LGGWNDRAFRWNNVAVERFPIRRNPPQRTRDNQSRESSDGLLHDLNLHTLVPAVSSGPALQSGGKRPLDYGLQSDKIRANDDSPQLGVSVSRPRVPANRTRRHRRLNGETKMLNMRLLIALSALCAGALAITAAAQGRQPYPNAVTDQLIHAKTAM